GRLVSEEIQNDSIRYVWEFDKPISGIGWICAGKFWRQSIMMKDIPLSVHLFNEDSSHGPKVLSQAKEILEFFSHRFTPYRFPKFSIVEVDDWLAGKNVLALATQSFILVKKLAFITDDRFNKVEMILPHEIAHQWWPMTVFIQDEDAAFLAEGMCEYSALLYNESRGTMTIRDSLNHHPLLRPLIMRTLKSVDFPLQKKADIRSFPTQYLKASYVHNMLRRIVGDSVFNEIYKEYAYRFTERRVQLNDFQTLAEELSVKKLKWFFDQWITSKGLPRLKIYNVKTNPVGNRWVTQGRVRMVGYEKYSTFIEVGAEINTGIVKTDVWLGTDSLGNYRNDVPFEIVSGSKPGRVMLDPNGDVLKIRKLPVKFSDLRDPSDGIMIIGTMNNHIELLQRARRDSSEMDMAGWSIRMKDDSAITLADLQQERVFVYGKASENLVAADLQEKFPISFRSDSVLIPQGLSLKGEVIFDSTLTLMQAIENPFIPQGLLYWIAPLSNRAESDLLPFDHSWVLVRGKDEIASGVWEMRDEDVVVEIK
ncbi:MAG TPA: M1 family aminopeptidase, partial [Bacteroidota bacterium]|nr:M1 family aminopeptidase [Bacteroidota bacterium]